MHVFVLTKEFPPRVLGGAGVVAYEHARRMARVPGARVTVITAASGTRRPRRRPHWSEAGGMRVLRVPMRRPFMVGGRFQASALAPWLRPALASGPQVLYVHSPDALPLVRWFRQLGPVPVVYMCHSLIADELRGGTSPRRRRQESLLRLASYILVPSAYGRHALIRRYPGYAAKVRLIPHGVRRPRRSSVGRRRRRFRLLFVGRLSPLKGVDVLVRALPRVVRRYPRVRLDVVGTGSRVRRLRLRRLVQRLGLRRHVRFRGYVPPGRLEPYYRRAAAVVVPSRQEFLGLVALEALANGAPLIVANVGGLRQIPRGIAYKVPARKPAALARAIAHLLAHPSAAAARTRRGRRWVNRFTWRRSVARVWRVLQAAAGRQVGR